LLKHQNMLNVFYIFVSIQNLLSYSFRKYEGYSSDGIRGGNMTTSATAPIIIKNPIRATNVANPKNVGSEKRMNAAERENGVIVEITSMANNLFVFWFISLMEGC
ncbi:MAG: hypothetical protein WCF03_19740, partial [Nitrososphaeraceae archaeon]